jgi:hypothetical protein
VLTPGVYTFSSAAQLTGTLTLNGLGNPNAVFIFKIGLTTASGSSVVLINGAQGGNVFFKVGSSATLGTGTSFSADVLALTSIELNTGANINCGAARGSCRSECPSLAGSSARAGRLPVRFLEWT